MWLLREIACGQGSGAGTAGVDTFRLEPEPPEHFVRSRGGNRLKKSRLRLQKRGKNHKKQAQNVKRENTESIIFIAQFLPFSRTGELE